MRTRPITLVLGLAMLGSIAAHAQGKAQAPAKSSVQVKEDTPGLLKRAKINADAATATALATVPGGMIASAEIEEEDGALIYSFDIRSAAKKGVTEVHVSALTGKVVKTEHEGAAEEAKEAARDKGKAKPSAIVPGKSPVKTPTKKPI